MDEHLAYHLPDLALEIVLSHLQSLADRASFRGVCRQWAAVWRDQWPRTPPMPWLAAPGHCVALSDASVHRVPLPNGVDVDGIVCCGSLGNWIALAPKRRRWRPRHQVRHLLLNPFSGASVQLPILTPAAFRGGGDDINVEKIVISSAPDSDGCVVAAIVMGSYSSTREIVIWRRGQESWSTPAAAAPSNVADAVFHGGDLYVVDKCSQLYVFSGDDGGGGQELHPVRLEMDLTRTGRFMARVLLECDGRLLMADRHRHGGDAGYHEYSVYALERDAACGDWCWSPVTRLDGHVLFLGAGCCRALPVTGRDRVKDGNVVFLDDSAEITAVVTVDDRKPLERSALIRRSMDVPASNVMDTFRRRGGGGGGRPASPAASMAGRRNQCFGFGGLQDLIVLMKSFMSPQEDECTHRQ
ncbi:uncharacterized protein LOC127781069 [Oryza glaberrima]|uniref:DUF295 domain-containing protein n=1 Tax=Oryza glaberrima TaxID=4538 RepID=I1QHU0_ORYGL|nr:uncharacterized protein LOC127781069 [Oryza glaberrima]